MGPEVGRNGKGRRPLRPALGQGGGHPPVRGGGPGVESLAGWDLVVGTTERLAPLWEPGTANGYHAINFGWIVGELVRRLDGRDVVTFLAEEVAGPLGLDGCYIGTPPEEHARVAPLRAARLGTGPTFDAIPPDSLAYRALQPDGDMTEFLNTPLGLSTCGPAFSGAFTARSLATLYAALERGGALDATRLVSSETLAAAATVQNTRADLVLAMPIYWRLGFMGGGSAVSPAGPNAEAFGHAGFGGSVAFADPKAELAVAVVLDLLELDLLAGGRTRDVVHAAVRAATEA